MQIQHLTIFKRLPLYAALLCALLCLGGGNALGLDRPLCEACRRDWIDSPSRMQLILSFKKHLRSYYLCSPECYCEFMEDYPDKTPDQVRIMDYRDRDQIHPTMFTVDGMTFLLGIAGKESKSHPPLVGAFGTAAAAKEAQKTLGGEIMSWKEVVKVCAKVAKNEEPPPDPLPPPLKLPGRSKPGK